jgi:hypothetical protein
MKAAEHLSIYINSSPADVYAFASNPANLPLWAEGVARSEVTQEGSDWIADAPFGKVKIRFTEKNHLGVLDHEVELDTGVSFHNPMRVIRNGEGSEFVFTLYRQPDMSDEQYAADRAAIEADLLTLKKILERG